MRGQPFEVVTNAPGAMAHEDGKQRKPIVPVKRIATAFVVGAFLLMMSQNLMAPNLTAIARDFNLDDHARDKILGGWMSTCFFLIGGPMSLIVGYLVDVSNRKNLFLWVMALGFAVVGLTAVATKIWQLLFLRSILGGVIGGLLPLLFSIFGDLYPPSKRSTVAAIVGTASGGGVLIGQVMAGTFSHTYGWKFPYFLVAVMGVGAMYFVHAFAIEPVRGGAEAAVVDPTDGPNPPPTPAAIAVKPAPAEGGSSNSGHDGNIYSSSLDLATLRRVFSIRSNQLIFAQAFPGTIPWGVIIVFLNDYLSQDQGFSVAQATFIVLIFGIGAAVGGLIGGMLGQRAYNRSPRLLPLFIGVCQILACLPMISVINIQVDHNNYTKITQMQVHSMAFLGGALASVTGPNLKAMLLNVNTPDTRGTVFCAMYLADSFGKGVGPYVVSLLIQYVGSRPHVFNMSMLGWVASGSLILAVSAFVKRDEVEARARIRSAMQNAKF